MKQIYSGLVIWLLAICTVSAQTNTAYYYQNASVPVALSGTIMCVKFYPGLTNLDKQNIITASQGTLINSDWNDIPDYVRVKSTVTTWREKVYPCGDGPAPADTLSRTNVSIVAKPAPCEGCPDCTPYYVTHTNNNFPDVISYFLQNLNITSASPLATISGESIGTDENFYIKIKTPYTISDFSSLLTNNYLTAADQSTELGTGVYKISISRPDTKNCFLKAITFYQSGMCDFSTPDFYQFGNVTLSNDPLFVQQWNIMNTGQTGGASGSDVRAVPAWNLSKGNGVTVAVIDDGVITTHPDLMANLLQGYNAEDHSNSGAPYLRNNHGTNCAGIIGAVADNNIGITGVAPEAKLLPVRIYTPTSNRYLTSAAAEGIQWAWQHGADVLSNSWHFTVSDLITNAIQNAVTLGRSNKGCVVAFAAGNYDFNYIYYPASLDVVIACGMMTSCNERVNPYNNTCNAQSGNGSHYGTALDVMAPGIDIVTTEAFNASDYTGNFGGTSAATPHVAATAALMLGVNPNLTQSEVRRLLNFSCNKVGNYCYTWDPGHPDGLWNEEMGYGRINAYNAVQLARPGVTISTPQFNVPSQANAQVSGNIGIVFAPGICPRSLPAGTNFVKRFEVTTQINYPSTPNPVILCSSNGFNLANPNDGRKFAEAINVTNTSATLRTYVYYAYNYLGQQLGWIPTAPANIRFTYAVISSPTAITYQTQKVQQLSPETIRSNNYPFNLELDPAPVKNDIPVEVNGMYLTPNPAVNDITLSFPAEQNGTKMITISTLVGQNIFQKEYAVSKGSNSIKLDIRKYAKGMYILTCGEKSIKFIKE